MKREDEELVQISLKEPDGFIADLQVVGCYINRGDNYLFLKKAKGRNQELTWGVAGGRIEQSELPEDAVIREVFEETGIAVNRDALCFEKKLFVDNPFFGKYILHLFYYPCEADQKIMLSDEHTDHLWVTLDEARSLPLLHGGYKSLNLFDSKK